MSEHQDVVDEILGFLQSAEHTKSDRVAQLADSYAGLCTDANARLRRCHEFLRQGMRSEAVHLAEAEPKLLDVVAVLDFAERAEWDEIVATYGLAKAPPLLIEVAEELNEAYALEQPLEKLLKRHRLLALARAPLSKRIATMKRITELDADVNAFWDEDIQTFEKARLHEIEEESERALRERQLPVLTGIRDELTRTRWTAPPPSAVVNRVKEWTQSLIRANAREVLERLEVELNAAFGELDVELGRQLREQWRSFEGDAALADDDPILEPVGPALEWLDAEDKREASERDYQRAVLQLEQELDGEVSEQQLERLGHEVLKHEREMPAALAARYRTRLASLEVAARGRHRLILAATALAIVFIAGAVGLILRGQVHSRRVADTADVLAAMLERQQLAEARSYFMGLTERDSRTANAPAIVEIEARLSGKEEEEARRATECKEAIERSEAELEKATAQPANTAIANDEPPSLMLARSLARLPDEKAAVDRISRLWARAAHKALAARGGEFREGIDALATQVAALEDHVRESLIAESTIALRVKIEKRVAELSREKAKVSAEVAGLLDPLDVRVRLIREEQHDRQRELRYEDDITNSIGDAAKFVKLLTDYREAFPESPRADDLKRALDETEVLRAVVRWEAITRGWSGRPSAVDPHTAAARVDECRRFLETNPSAPDVALVRDYLALAEAVVRREQGEGGGAQLRLERLFSDILIADVWHVRTKGGENYYIPGSKEAPQEIRTLRPKNSEIPETIAHVQFRYLSSFDGKNPSTRVRKDEVARSAPAPQSIIANEVKLQLRNLRNESWEETMITIATRIREDQEIAPILQLTLLDRVFELASSGSYALQGAFRAQRRAIESANLDLSVPWMDPENEDAIRLRPRAAALLERLPSLQASAEVARKELARINTAISGRRKWFGWLIKDRKGTWSIRFGGPVEEGSTLWVVVPGRGDSNDWKKIGTYQDGNGNLSRGVRSELLEGRPVFAQATPVK